MKKPCHLLAIGAAIFGLSVNVFGYERAAEAMKAARQKAQDKDYAGAAKDAEEAIALAGGNTSEKIEALFFKGQLAEWSKQYGVAKEAYARVALDTGAVVAQKVLAQNKIAGVCIAENRMEDARVAYGRIAGVAGVTAADVFNAKIATAKSHELQMAYDKASEIYSAIDADATSTRVHRIQAIRANAALLMLRYQYDAARAEYGRILAVPDCAARDRAEVAMDIARTYENDFAKVRVEYSKALEVDGLDANGKVAVLTAIARTYKSEVDLVRMRQTLEAISALVTTPDYILLREYALLAALKEDAAEELAAWDRILAIPKLNNDQFAQALFKKIGVLGASRKMEEARRIANDAAQDVRLSEEQKCLAALLGAGFGVLRSGKLETLTMPVSAMDAGKQVKVYTDAAKIFMRARGYEVARFLGDRAAAMFPSEPNPVYECRFMERAPFGVAGWQSSDLRKDLSRRATRFEAYDKKAAAVLINDVNSSRAVGAGGGKDGNVGFWMAADVRGWHIYVERQDEQMEQVVAGLLGGGQMEVFFAPGQGECYYQWIMDISSGKTDYYPWTSPHRSYRKMDNYFRGEVAPVPGGVGVYMFLPWELVYDKLPKEGDLWTFGLVDWARAGGVTWGSGQVHELNKFGKIRFADAGKFLPAIKRAIVMKALGNYKKASASAAVFWKDEVKGDLDFFNKKLLPEMEKLNELGKFVRPEMTQPETDMLFEKAVPDWMEFNYKASELRSEFMEDKLFVQ